MGEIRQESNVIIGTIKSSYITNRPDSIDVYIETYDEIPYTYDFWDGWRLVIKLEKIVEDYKYGYPTLIAGAETAPPEDVGGLYGYEEFLKAYHDEDDPEHQSTKRWAKSQLYREYDEEHINMMLKSIKYKKNE